MMQKKSLKLGSCLMIVLMLCPYQLLAQTTEGEKKSSTTTPSATTTKKKPPKKTKTKKKATPIKTTTTAKKTTLPKTIPKQSDNSRNSNSSNTNTVTENERIFWESIRDSRNPSDFQAYIRKYPNGKYTSLAQNRLNEIEGERKKEEARKAAEEEEEEQEKEKIRKQEEALKTKESLKQEVKQEETSKQLEVKTNNNDISNSTSPRSFQNRYGMEFVLIPSGEFMMGADNEQVQMAYKNAKAYFKDAKLEWFINETPRHGIKIKYSFYVGKYEVTQGQWKSVMGVNHSGFRGSDKLPVEYVSWNDAQNFVKKLNKLNDGYEYRLPSEAEWEYAARAGTTSDYTGDIDSIAWYANNSCDQYINILKEQKKYIEQLNKNKCHTHEVGTKQANTFGLYDMYGNVAEWCQDVYKSNYEGVPTDGSPNLSKNSRAKVIRGGSWFDSVFELRATKRRWEVSMSWDSSLVSYEIKDFTIGFRVVALAKSK